MNSLPSQAKKIISACLSFSFVLAALSSVGQGRGQNSAEELAAEVAQLIAEVQLLEDENEIENLQKIFGFYIDKRFWTQAADLFTDNGTLEISGEGVYVGKDRVQEYLYTIMGQGEEVEGPLFGILNDHMQLQPVITIANNGTAKARWHHFSQEGVEQESQTWGTGIYENTYVKEDGVWKIQALHLYSTMRSPYEAGWGKVALERTSPSTILPPDQSSTVDYQNYPNVYVVPFHYENPVTGSRSSAAVNLPSVVDSSIGGIKTNLASLDKRIGLLQDADAVEYVHVIYGYYLARNQWDELTGIFAKEGTIEIAMRGVYEGLPSVRRNLDLYGVQGELAGTLHNHMQYQPVIHIAEDGQSALMRSRAFSMMGSYQGVGTWMGGVYENLFVKEDGVWKIGTDQVFNTYFAGYDQGWKGSVARSAPGINNDNPPDSPPTVTFTMFPGVYLPPFHYKNPVTGTE